MITINPSLIVKSRNTKEPFERSYSEEDIWDTEDKYSSIIANSKGSCSSRKKMRQKFENRYKNE